MKLRFGAERRSTQLAKDISAHTLRVMPRPLQVRRLSPVPKILFDVKQKRCHGPINLTLANQGNGGLRTLQAVLGSLQLAQEQGGRPGSRSHRKRKNSLRR
ncbi:MAG: hypothetical protein AAF368_17990, partial [Planctomycetota bacterium]